MSFPTVAGQAVEGVPYREAQVCLGPSFASAYYLFFQSGTSTPANVYSNGTLTTAFSPTGKVTADAYGRFQPIYLDTSVTYRVQLFNSANVQLWQVDPYVPPLSTVGTSSLSPYGFQIAPTGEITFDVPNSGGAPYTLGINAGALGTAAIKMTGTLAGNSALIVNSSATTGAQTATFAATNKPGTATSSPAGWLPITCDGVQYYTPIWHGNNFTPYAPNPSANGETITSTGTPTVTPGAVTFSGSGLTTVNGVGSATPPNWFSPATPAIGAGYYINITKTFGLSGINFSAAQSSWTNIGAGGLTITSNGNQPITGTYQLSTSISGSPIVANGTIFLAGNDGVTGVNWNGVTPLLLVSNGTTALGGVSTSGWYKPTTAGIGASYYLQITQTGGTAGATFSAATSAPTNIGGGLTVGISGGSGAMFNVTGTYVISTDAGGTNQVGTGSITLTGSSVQSNNWSGGQPLFLASNGNAQVNHSIVPGWYSPASTGVGAGFWINITRTGGTTNFSAAQGAWTNIGAGLTIGTTGTPGTNVTGTYQISSSSTGTPVLGSGTITLNS